MKKLLVLVASTIVLASCSTNAELQRELNAYKQYYNATEKFLDELEKEYNWVDGHDPYDYYEAVEELNKYK